MPIQFAAAAYVVLVAVMSLVCFTAYGLDKGRARRGERRISEHSLQVMALLGGWPGAIAAQRYFRHKTQKLRFLAVFWLLVTIHVIAIGAITYAIVQAAD